MGPLLNPVCDDDLKQGVGGAKQKWRVPNLRFARLDLAHHHSRPPRLHVPLSESSKVRGEGLGPLA